MPFPLVHYDTVRRGMSYQRTNDGIVRWWLRLSVNSPLAIGRENRGRGRDLAHWSLSRWIMQFGGGSVDTTARHLVLEMLRQLGVDPGDCSEAHLQTFEAYNPDLVLLTELNRGIRRS